jgi:hypothetical protein
LRLGEPEQVAVDPRQEIVALERVARSEACAVEGGRPCACGPQPLDLLRDCAGAEVLHTAVEFVAARIDREHRVGREIVLEIGGDEPVPVGVRGCGSRLRRRARRCAAGGRLPVAGDREQHDHKPATDPR